MDNCNICYCIICDNKRVLLSGSAKGVSFPCVVLPTQDVSFFPDYVPFIRGKLKEMYNLDVVVLSHLESRANNIHYCEAEIINNQLPRKSKCKRYLLKNIKDIFWSDKKQREYLTSWEKNKSDIKRAEWEKPGQYASTLSSIKKELLRYGIKPKRFYQVKGAWSWSSIIKISTNQGILYYKKNYKKRPAESLIIMLLSNKWRKNLPFIISKDIYDDWFIMKDFCGEALEFECIELKRKAVEIYADMQIDSIGNLEEFKKNGCMVLSMPFLVKCFNSVIEVNKDWAELNNIEVGLLIRWVKNKCDLLTKVGNIHTIHNEDFREGNIVVRNDDIIIYDWKNISIAHPFFSIEYFLRRIETKGKVKEYLLRAYLVKWKKIYSMEQINMMYSIIEKLFDVYDAVKCFCDLEYLEYKTPWYQNTEEHIKDCIKNIYNKIEDTISNKI